MDDTRKVWRSMYQKYVRETNYYETDQMSIIHHSNYIRYFEEARLDWLKQMGMDYQKIEEMGILIPVMFVDCQYVKPIRYGEKLEIGVTLTKMKGVKAEFSYEIYRQETGELCTTGHSGHCFLNRDMKPVRLKRDYPELYQVLSSADVSEYTQK